jgi:hypothetical protein
MYTHTTTVYGNDEVTPTLINWRAVFGGAVIGIGILTLLSALWLAMAFPSNVSFVGDNLRWFLAGTGIFALFVAGYLAGVISGARGLGAGLIQALTLWAVVVIASVAVAIPAALRILNVNVVTAPSGIGLTGSPLWTGFWSMLIALGACMLGGVLGGATPRRVTAPTTGVAAVPEPATTAPADRVTESPVRERTERRPRRVS